MKINKKCIWILKLTKQYPIKIHIKKLFESLTESFLDVLN